MDHEKYRISDQTVVLLTTVWQHIQFKCTLRIFSFALLFITIDIIMRLAFRICIRSLNTFRADRLDSLPFLQRRVIANYSLALLNDLIVSHHRSASVYMYISIHIFACIYYLLYHCPFLVNWFVFCRWCHSLISQPSLWYRYYFNHFNHFNWPISVCTVNKCGKFITQRYLHSWRAHEITLIYLSDMCAGCRILFAIELADAIIVLSI